MNISIIVTNVQRIIEKSGDRYIFIQYHYILLIIPSTQAPYSNNFPKRVCFFEFIVVDLR